MWVFFFHFSRFLSWPRTLYFWRVQTYLPDYNIEWMKGSFINYAITKGLKFLHLQNHYLQFPEIHIMPYIVGWPRTMYYFAKPRPIFKFRTVLNSWDHSTSKFFSTFCCMTLFKGRASALKFSTFLHYPKREECISRTLCFVVNH